MYKTLILLIIALLAQSPAHAINAKYRQQLERSGCTQVSDAQGCDITKSRKENAKAGFATTPATKTGTTAKNPGGENPIRRHGGHGSHR